LEKSRKFEKKTLCATRKRSDEKSPRKKPSEKSRKKGLGKEASCGSQGSRENFKKGLSGRGTTRKGTTKTEVERRRDEHTWQTVARPCRRTGERIKRSENKR